MVDIDTNAIDKAPETYQGIASFYHDKFEGRCTCAGQIFWQSGKTVATFRPKEIPIGSIVEISYLNKKTGEEKIIKDVLVNDLGGPQFQNVRLVDLSSSLFSELDSPSKGLLQVNVRVTGKKRIKRLQECYK